MNDFDISFRFLSFSIICVYMAYRKLQIPSSFSHSASHAEMSFSLGLVGRAK